MKRNRWKTAAGLLATFGLMSVLPASENLDTPTLPGQVIPDLGFEPIVDAADMRLEPPLVEYSVDEPGELDYLIPEPDESGDDMVSPGRPNGSQSGIPKYQ